MINILQRISDNKDQLELFLPYCEEAEKQFSKEQLYFLEDEFIRKWAEFACFDEEVQKVLLESSDILRSDSSLLHLTWLFYYLTCERLGYPDENFKHWPNLEKIVGHKYSGSVFILIALACIPFTQKKHENKNISIDITKETCSDVKTHSETYYNFEKEIGIFPKSLGWFRKWMREELFQIGRFQYMIKPFSGNVEVYINRKSEEVIALALDGSEFNNDGYSPVKDASFNEKAAWTARLVHGSKSVKGSPVWPYGVAQKKEIVLDKNVWECVVNKETLLLDVHIPACGGMSLDACKGSMVRAASFFEEHFPEKAALGFQCVSWILNPEFENMLDARSNLLRFQRELYLFPVNGGGLAGVDRVFGSSPIDIATAPRDSSLRRSMLDRIRKGKPLRCGGMFFLKENLEHFGTGFYLKNIGRN